MWPFDTDTKAEQHQKGKEDADRGEYDPPSGLSDVSGFNRLGDTCGFEEKNKAYEEGRSKGGK